MIIFHHQHFWNGIIIPTRYSDFVVLNSKFIWLIDRVIIWKYRFAQLRDKSIIFIISNCQSDPQDLYAAMRSRLINLRSFAIIRTPAYAYVVIKKRELHTLAEPSAHLSTFFNHIFSRKVLGTRTLLLSDPATIPAVLTRRAVQRCRTCCYTR